MNSVFNRAASAAGFIRIAAPLFWVAALGGGLCVGLGGYTFLYARGLSYLSNDPRACANCHVMQKHYDGWVKASHHAAATCNDCHTPHDLVGKYMTKAENGYHHSRAFTLQTFPEPIRIKPKNLRILEQNCVRCHETLVADIIPRDNARSEEPDCVRCHADVGHDTD